MKKKGKKAKHFWPAFDFGAFLLLYFALAGGRLSANRLRLMCAACVCVLLRFTFSFSISSMTMTLASN